MLKVIFLSFFLLHPLQEKVAVTPEKPAEQPETKTTATDSSRRASDAGSQRNQNIQINLIDNNALNEQLGRQGMQISPIREFTAARSNYAAELGGLGRALEVAVPDLRNAYHGEIYGNLQNSVFNARTFFQVGPVEKSIRSQYGFNAGGPLGERLSFVFAGEEIRQNGYVNGNTLVPLASERTPQTSDPRAYALISKWLAAYPAKLPNRPKIDPRMLNTNAPQTIRNSGGSVHIDWRIGTGRQVTFRYALRDTYIDSFKFVAGQNPNQRFRPQDFKLSLEQQLTRREMLRLSFNYYRQKSDLAIPPGAVGPYLGMARQIEDLGPKNEFPMYRVRNDFEYVAQMTHLRGAHTLEWGAEIRRYQMNDLQSTEARGNFGFSTNFGRTAIENLLTGTPNNFKVTIGDLYRGFRNTDGGGFVNDRWKVTPSLTLTAGVRYEMAGAPSEVNGLTRFSYTSDWNNAGPHFGFGYSAGSTVVRGGYGISFGRVFPATFQMARFNAPEVLRINIPNPSLIDPLQGWTPNPAEFQRSTMTSLDSDLVVPYSQQYTLQMERDLPWDVRLRLAYIGSRTWKLIQTVHGNRAVRPAGIPVTSGTINDRRPDKRYFGTVNFTNMGRAYLDAAQLSVEKRLASTFFNATYTWGKAIDTGTMFSNTQVNNDELRSQTEGGIIQDMKGPSVFDVRHNLVLSYAAPMPLGWVLTGTVLLRTGTPFTVEMGSDSPPLGNVDGEWNDRPSILDPGILHRSVDHPDTSQSVLPRSAFSTVDSFLNGRGNLGRNTFRKDGAANFNAALSRTFQFADPGKALVFRAEALNLTNHPQFDAPIFNFSSPSFGQITNTLNAGRILQFALNLRF